jgi:hypothetical protein
MSFIPAACIDSHLLATSIAARYCRDYQKYPDKFIQNLQTDLFLWKQDQHALICSSNLPQTQKTLSYVVSPYCAYVDYCLVEIERLNRPRVTWPLSLLVKTIALWLRVTKIDACLQINNWLLSTNLFFGHLQKKDVQVLRDQAIKKFPQQALVFRSLNYFSNAALINLLENEGFILVPSRQVYIFDAKAGEESELMRSHNFQLDRKFLRKTCLTWKDAKDFSDEDFESAARLYAMLYLEKYCQHNPAYTANWLRAGHESGWLRLQGLVDDAGQLQGVVGWFENDELITAPIVGYNTDLPKKTGLYRLLTQACLEEAIRQKKTLNFSSGAAQFKRLRGGKAEIEYSLVYVKHLNVFRRATWKVMSFLLNLLAVPLMKKWQL